MHQKNKACQLVLCDSKRKLGRTIGSSFEQVAKKLVSKIEEPENTLVVCEGAGGCEFVLVESMHAAGIAVAVANGRQVRDFAKGHGILEKSDSIDAAVNMEFDQDVELHLATPGTARVLSTSIFTES